VQAAIAADPDLDDLGWWTADGRREAETALKFAAWDERAAQFREPSKVKVQSKYSYGQPVPDAAVSAAFVADIEARLKGGALGRHLDDPDAEPVDALDEQFKLYAAVYREADDPVRNPKMNLFAPDGSNLGAYVTFGSIITDYEAQHPERFKVTVDADTEKAVSKVGAVVYADYKAKVDAVVAPMIAANDEKLAALQTEFGDLFDKFPNLRWTYQADGSPMALTYNMSAIESKEWWSSANSDRRKAFLARLGEVQVAPVSADAKPVKEARQAVFVETIGNITPVGGSFRGAPTVSKKTKGATKTTKELVDEASALVPSGWIDLSNQRGEVTFKRTKGRAHYKHESGSPHGTVTLGSVAVGVHEMMHRVEHSNPAIRELERVFHDRRTEGETAKWLGSGYAKKEKGKEDKFFNKYAGKVYNDGYWELLSMGYEYGYRGDAGLADDADYLGFIFGTVAVTTRPPKGVSIPLPTSPVEIPTGVPV
jgi:hypothetical protein